MAPDARAYNKYYVLTRASHDHGSRTAYDRHYRCFGAAEWMNPSGQLVVGLYKVVIKAIIEFSCVQYIKNIYITSYDVSIGSWLDLLQLVWIGLA